MFSRESKYYEEKELMQMAKCLESAFATPPKPADSERLKFSQLPRLQYETPAEWPKSPPHFLLPDIAKFYSGLTEELLFFDFYFQEGSLAQIMAARTLKKRNWKFHKVYRIWFQRIGEASISNTEFERGNYRYWNYREWKEEVKYNFTFVISLMENVDLNGWPVC
ncbi:hypothetical protein RvY_00072 [Ramazzottius varieornatus]|uniref:NOT2/NOT3/NOT5 C-terminal domain-containing protein n=1 Tax=Ramazzottius varieornatus TaxID=947166 RepID=A0A1D1UHS7_RAMVA|nr:hypothetical protein RvY_00072 [Ramazzottius varieornatus]